MTDLEGQGRTSEFDRAPPAPASVARVWRQHRRWLAAVLYAHMPRGGDLDDLLQEVAMKLVKSIQRLRRTDAIRPWLRTVAVNTARSAARRASAHARVVGPNAGLLVATSDNGTKAPRADVPPALDSDALARGRRMLELVRELPAAYCEPLLLSLRGLTQKQIAAALDLPITTIETRLIRARRMVRDEMERTESLASDLPSGGNGHPAGAATERRTARGGAAS